jgi:mono/diheme cytochrome c family protein
MMSGSRRATAVGLVGPGLALAFTLAMVAGGTAGASGPLSGEVRAEPASASVHALPGQGDGSQVYDQRCSSCHQPGGVGVPGSFPPLRGNANATDAAYVERVIIDGRTGVIEVDGVSYDSVMAAVDLSDAERAAVVAYVVELASSDASPIEAAPTAAEPVVGDAERGRRLFTGATALGNGGGACSACHQVGDLGFRGGRLGPNLDLSFTNLGGEAGMSAWLANPASPTMAPIFSGTPLTDDEIADLVAYLEVAPDQDKSTAPGGYLFVLGGGAGLAALLIGMALARRSVTPSYSQRLRTKR